MSSRTKRWTSFRKRSTRSGGATDTTFRYSAKLENGSDQEITTNLAAETPRGVQVDFKSGGKLRHQMLLFALRGPLLPAKLT
jgi:hypothetical protein